MSNDKKADIVNFPVSRIHRQAAVGAGELAKKNMSAAVEQSKRLAITELAKTYSAAIIRECAGFGIGTDHIISMMTTGTIPVELRKHLCFLHLAIEATVCRLDKMDNGLDTTIDKLIPDGSDGVTISTDQINLIEDNVTRKAVLKFLNGYDKTPDKIDSLIKSLRKAVSK